MVDYGGSWPEGSPHAIGREIADRLDDEESESMGRVATLVEQSRYAPPASIHGDAISELPTMTSEIRRGVAAPADWRRRSCAVTSTVALPAIAEGAVISRREATRLSILEERVANLGRGSDS